jgi:hypothetical protein
MAQAFTFPRAAPVSYDADFHAWLMEQAAKLRAGDFSDLDIENIAEELEGLARSDVRSLKSAYEELLFHLLKWVYQPELRDRENHLDSLENSWRRSILKQRNKIADILEESPSLTAREGEILDTAYSRALERAEAEAGKAGRPERFPATRSWTLEQVKDKRFPAGILPEK